MMLGRPEEALGALDALAAEGSPSELAEGGPDGLNLRAAILTTMGELEEADAINLSALAGARSEHQGPLIEASLIGLGESRLAAGARRSASRYAGEAERTTVGDYPFRWLHRGRARLLQARLELAGGNRKRAVSAAHELLASSSESTDVVRLLAARLLEAEAVAASGAAIDTMAVGEMLDSAAEVLGGEAWRLTAQLAHVTGNAEWAALAQRQLEQLVRASGAHAPGVRRFAGPFLERLSRSA
jgi:hypothetical protein